MASEEDLRLRPQVYVDERPAEYFTRFHEHARTHEPGWVYWLVKVLSDPYVRLAFRLKAYGLEKVPASGPVIVAPNHFSAMDHWFVGIRLWPRRVRFMAKSQLFRGRGLEYIMAHGGAFPVRRGQRDEEAIKTALTILERGGVIVIYPEGGRSRTGRLGSSARPGIGRLALESGAPVVPVAVRGSERARHWRRLRFPDVAVRYGDALRFDVEPDPLGNASRRLPIRSSPTSASFTRRRRLSDSSKAPPLRRPCGDRGQPGRRGPMTAQRVGTVSRVAL